MERKEHLEPNKNKKSIVIGEQIGPNIANLGLGVFSFLHQEDSLSSQPPKHEDSPTTTQIPERESTSKLSDFTFNTPDAIPLPDFTDSPSAQVDSSLLEQVDRTLSGFIRPEKVDLSALQQKENPPNPSISLEPLEPLEETSLLPAENFSPLEEESNPFEIPLPEFTEAPSSLADPEILSQVDQTLQAFVRPEKVEAKELLTPKNSLQKKWPRQVEEEVGTPFTLPQARQKILTEEKITIASEPPKIAEPTPVVAEIAPTTSSYDTSSLKVRQKTERIEKKEHIFRATSSDEGALLREAMREPEIPVATPLVEIKPTLKRKDRSIFFTFLLALLLFGGMVGYAQLEKWLAEQKEKERLNARQTNEVSPLSITLSKEFQTVHRFLQDKKFEQAEPLLKKLRQQYPQEVAILLVYTELLVAQKRFDEASPFLRQLSVSSLDSTQQLHYYLLQTETDLAQENLASAWNGISQSLQLDPQSTKALKFRAHYYYLKKAYSFVIQDATEVLKNAPESDLELLKLRAFSYYWKNQFLEALTDLKLLSGPEILLKRARCYANLGELENASNDYIRYLAIHPDDQEARQENIQLLEKLGQTENVVQELQKLGQAIPVPILYKQAIQCYQEEKWDEALKILAQVLKQQPDYWQAEDLRSKIFYKQEKWTDCLATISAVIRHQPSPASYKLRGVVYFKLKQFTEAINDFSASLSEEATDIQLYYYRGMCFESLQGQELRAIQDYTSALKLRPDFVEALQRRAYLFERAENYELALKDYTELLELRPQGSFYFARGNLYRLLREENKALEDYHQAIQHAPENLRYYNQRAIFYFSINQYEEAIRDWKHILLQDPQQAPTLTKMIQKAEEKRREELK